jgi:hypothetical protein
MMVSMAILSEDKGLAFKQISDKAPSKKKVCQWADLLVLVISE